MFLMVEIIFNFREKPAYFLSSQIEAYQNFSNTHTAQDQHFKFKILNLWINWKNLCPNLSFTVENKMGNSHKKGWPND